MSDLKKLHCNVCDKDFKINYFYTHRKTKKHLKKCKKEIVLLKIDDDDVNKDNHIKIFLDNIKNKIDEFLKKI
jgi:hypothetical protein